MKKWFALALVGFAILILTSCAYPNPYVVPEGRSKSESVVPSAETWAFCGVHPDDPAADAKLRTLSNSAGIDAIFGRCNPPDWSTYTPANPTVRYMNADEYKRLAIAASRHGIKTVVYDARVWSSDPAVRQEALNFWMPLKDWVRAWDMGDEFDPISPDWQLLIQRWYIVLDHITPQIGVGPVTNNLGGQSIADAALRDMPEQAKHYSFDAYGEGPNGEPTGIIDMTAHLRGRVDFLMCAINALDHSIYHPTPAKIEMQMQTGLREGCHGFLIFGGDMPFATAGFVSPSLVNADGSATALAGAVWRGARG